MIGVIVHYKDAISHLEMDLCYKFNKLTDCYFLRFRLPLDDIRAGNSENDVNFVEIAMVWAKFNHSFCFVRYPFVK